MGSPAIGNAASRISIDADAAVNDVRHGNHRVHDALPTPEELNAGPLPRLKKQLPPWPHVRRNRPSNGDEGESPQSRKKHGEAGISRICPPFPGFGEYRRLQG